MKIIFRKAFSTLIIFIISRGALSLEIKNPYENVKWYKFHQYKANLHTHTTVSDGKLKPYEVVDRYRQLGYAILAITDHNKTTFPWEEFNRFGDYENRKSSELGMLSVQGNEFSDHHHLGSYFSNEVPAKDIEVSLKDIKKKDGLAVFFHPGRYNYSDTWYIDLYTRYPLIIGMEVYNQGNRSPIDQILWDRILTELMPDRSVWGFANDDMHSPEQIGLFWNPERTHTG